jgi:uncharacterized iron-regulated membrane protein
MPEKGRDIQAELKSGSTTIDVDIDPSTGMPASISEPQRFGVSMDAHNIVEAVHFGRIGGMSTQLLWITLGLCPTFLVITGYIMWWNRVLSKRLRAIS